MREVVIKSGLGVAFEKGREPAPGEPSSVAPPETPGAEAAQLAAFLDLAEAGAAPPAETVPAAGEGARPTSPRRARRRKERNFVVAYDGRFIGVFEARQELTPNEAFVRVAGDLACRKDFDPEKIRLYKLVLLRGARPPKRRKFVAGTLTEIGGRMREGQGDECAHATPAPLDAWVEPAASESPAEEHICTEPA